MTAGPRIPVIRVPIEQIARLVAHSETSVAGQVYRHQLRPVLKDGATAVNHIFPSAER